VFREGGGSERKEAGVGGKERVSLRIYGPDLLSPMLTGVPVQGGKVL